MIPLEDLNPNINMRFGSESALENRGSVSVALLDLYHNKKLSRKGEFLFKRAFDLFTLYNSRRVSKEYSKAFPLDSYSQILSLDLLASPICVSEGVFKTDADAPYNQGKTICLLSSIEYLSNRSTDISIVDFINKIKQTVADFKKVHNNPWNRLRDDQVDEICDDLKGSIFSLFTDRNNEVFRGHGDLHVFDSKFLMGALLICCLEKEHTDRNAGHVVSENLSEEDFHGDLRKTVNKSEEAYKHHAYMLLLKTVFDDLLLETVEKYLLKGGGIYGLLKTIQIFTLMKAIASNIDKHESGDFSAFNNHVRASHSIVYNTSRREMRWTISCYTPQIADFIYSIDADSHSIKEELNNLIIGTNDINPIENSLSKDLVSRFDWFNSTLINLLKKEETLSFKAFYQSNTDKILKSGMVSRNDFGQDLKIEGDAFYELVSSKDLLTNAKEKEQLFSRAMWRAPVLDSIYQRIPSEEESEMLKRMTKIFLFENKNRFISLGFIKKYMLLLWKYINYVSVRYKLRPIVKHCLDIIDRGDVSEEEINIISHVFLLLVFHTNVYKDLFINKVAEHIRNVLKKSFLSTKINVDVRKTNPPISGKKLNGLDKLSNKKKAIKIFLSFSKMLMSTLIFCFVLASIYGIYFYLDNK